MNSFFESPSSKILLTLSARNLKDCDVFSKSDPVCVVFVSSSLVRGDGKFRECGRTETIMNTLNPDWSEKILLEYFFEEVQKIRFEIYDIDSDSSDFTSQDFIGFAETTIAEIVGAAFSTKTFQLRGKHDTKKGLGELTVTAEEVDDEESHEIVTFQCRATNLDKKDFFGKSDPYLNIYRINDNGQRHLIHRTEVVKRSLNPCWRVFEIPAKQLCAGNPRRKIVIDCYDYNKIRSHNLIGSCETNAERLISRKVTELPLINETKNRRKRWNPTESGRLQFISVTTYRTHSFLEYIAGGTQLDFCIAVDMTASNGNPTLATSLHHIDCGQPNEYEIAIHAVADICQHYNRSKMFDAIGFGAKIPHNNQFIVDHCFPLDLKSNSYAVFGVPGLMEAYRHCIENCVLYGPTNFAPVIEYATRKAVDIPRDGSRYLILLIITDGCICDHDKTTSAIVAASFLPLSIIIVGVGGENFDKMRMLDSDDALLTASDGRKAQRDIVQFVSLRKLLKRNGGSGNYDLSMAQLAKEVLEEVPEQLTSYMKAHGIKPRPPDDPFQHPEPAQEHPNNQNFSSAAAGENGFVISNEAARYANIPFSSSEGRSCSQQTASETYALAQTTDQEKTPLSAQVSSLGEGTTIRGYRCLSDDAPPPYSLIN